MSAAEQTPTPKTRVLFICIGNSCRSPMAESIAMRDASDVFEIFSAGLAPLGVVQKATLLTLKENGYPIADLTSKAVQNEIWTSADLVINMSGYPKQSTFPRADWARIHDWEVKDPYGCSSDVYQSTFEFIRSRIEALAERYRTGSS